MPQLPASVRVAVWTSYAWSVGADAESILSPAMPDADLVLGLAEQLALWRDLGEQALYAALPRPGVSGLLPRCSPAAHGSATDAGEAVFVAGVGGLAIPVQVSFGDAEEGLAIRWERFDAEPVPIHRLAATSVAETDVALRTAVHRTADALGDGGWIDAWNRPGRPSTDREWSLPADLPDRVRSVIVRAGTVLEIAERGLEHADGSSSSFLMAQRTQALNSLRDAATRALESAAGAAASYFAAQSRSTRS